MVRAESMKRRVLDEAVRVASQAGLGGVTIGSLAEALGVSKGGLFAHFGSKEALGVEILQASAEAFAQEVFRPALRAPRGLGRVRALFEGWLGWVEGDERRPGGCVLIAAASELDDQPGPRRDFLQASQRRLLAALTQLFQGAIDEGEIAAGVDPEGLAFQLHSIILGFHITSRLLRHERAGELARGSFERLVASASEPAVRP
jgi:AcrR family transcriptional regulator